MVQATHILVKGMVCNRCKTTLETEIRKLGHLSVSITLGKVVFTTPLSDLEYQSVSSAIAGLGFETISSRQSRLILRVKEVVETLFEESTRPDSRVRFSLFISEAIRTNYDSISEAFSEHEGMTLERYVIQRRLEKVKELLVYTEHTLTGIAYLTGFNGLSHLSRQFKELTGLSPSYFRSIQREKGKISKGR